MAPERIRAGVPREAADAPAQVLRRPVLIRYPAGISATARRQQLIDTRLFNRVDLVPSRASTIAFAQANTEPLAAFSTDPHRWQWALPAINAPGPGGAWHYTLGRAQVASLDGGIVPTHPDVQAGPLSNLRAHQSVRAQLVPSGTALHPSQLDTGGVNLILINHGMHVNTLMAAPINGMGIAGVCPQCTLQTFRTEGIAETLPVTTQLAARFGSAAINHSYTPVNMGLNAYPFAVEDAIARDVVLIASAGNGGDGNTSWNDNSGVPHRYLAVLKIGATDHQNHLWSE